MTALTPAISGCQSDNSPSQNSKNGSSGSVSIDVGPARVDSVDQEDVVIVPLDVVGGYASYFTVKTTLLNGNEVVSQIDSIVEMAPPNRPVELRYTSDEEITDVRSELDGGSVGTAPPKDSIDVRFTEIVEDDYRIKLTAQLKNTGESKISVTPIPVFLDGETVIPFKLMASGSEVTLGPNESYQYEQDIIDYPPGSFTGAKVYPV